MLLYQILAFTYIEKCKKSHNKKIIKAKITNSKYQLRHGMKSLSYLKDHILYPMFKNVSNIS